MINRQEAPIQYLGGRLFIYFVVSSVNWRPADFESTFVQPRSSPTLSLSLSPDFGLALTFSVDWAVPKKIGTKASQTIQVVYIVKPIGFASLKVSGTPRLLTAYTVQVTYQQKQHRFPSNTDSTGFYSTTIIFIHCHQWVFNQYITMSTML